VGDFQGLVQLVVGRIRSIGAGGVASFGKVAVQSTMVRPFSIVSEPYT
jgi:hypothetical protein